MKVQVPPSAPSPKPRAQRGATFVAITAVWAHWFKATHPHGVRRITSAAGFYGNWFQSTHPHGVRQQKGFFAVTFACTYGNIFPQIRFILTKFRDFIKFFIFCLRILTTNMMFTIPSHYIKLFLHRFQFMTFDIYRIHMTSY